MATDRPENNRRNNYRAKDADDNGLYEQVTNALSRLDATTAQLENYYRRLDGRLDGISYTVDQIKPAATRNMSTNQMVRAVVEATESLAIQVQDLTSRTRRAEVDQGDMALAQMQRAHARARSDRVKEVDQNLRYIKRLEQCTTEVVDVCPCGKHKGIRFVETREIYMVGSNAQRQSVVIEENMCPKEWWIKQSRLAFERGELGEFTTLYPLADYLFAHSLD